MSQIQKSVQLLAETLVGKNKDYAGSRGEFYNFCEAADFAQSTPLTVMLSQIGIKFTRLASLENATNEPFKDSLLDLAGYAIIAHAYIESLENR